MPSSEWPDREARYEDDMKRAYDRDMTKAEALTAAAKASPVIPAPKCETCKGRKMVFPKGDDVPTACPDCHGTGVAEAIPVAVLRKFIARGREATTSAGRTLSDQSRGHLFALGMLEELLSEHTRKEPTQA